MIDLRIGKSATDYADITNLPTYFPSQISDVDGLQIALDDKLDNVSKGAPNGVAELSSGKVPLAQLPEATTMSAGTMSAADKAKLDGLGSGIARTSTTITTASLADLARGSGSVALAKTLCLLSIQLDRAARIRFYATAAIRDADLGRSIATEPVDGCFYDAQSTGAATFFGNTGAVTIFNGDSSATTSIYYTIDNLSGSTSTVAATLKYVPLEA